MGKILSGLLLGCLSLLPGAERVKLSIQPDPPVHDQKATLTGNPGDVIDLDWDPPAEPSSVTIGSNGKVTFSVPQNATSLIATDPDGDTQAWTVQ